MDKRAIREDG
jgi:hypothetical protein